VQSVYTFGVAMRLRIVAVVLAVVAVASLFLRRELEKRAAADDASFDAVVRLQDAPAPKRPVATDSSPTVPTVVEPPVRMEPHIYTALGVQLPPIVSPDWSDEMEARIMSHVALFPGAALTNLQVQCQEEVCIVLMQSDRTIDMFEFEFDRFAETNGFQGAVLLTPENARAVVLRR
jgi:hypothetical protein